MSEHFVIVGGGQAGGQAVATLRSSGFLGRLTLVGAEPYLPYQRPPLSKKFLAGEMPLERLWLRPQRFYQDKDVELRLKTAALELDPEAQRLQLSDGTALAYDKLLLATGSRVRRLTLPGHDLPGIHYLRSIADVASIRADLAAARRVVIIGGGYIGLEVAAVMRANGLAVTVVEALERVMARVVSPTVSAFYRQRHEAEGVRVLCDTPVAAFVGGDRVSAVRTAGAELSCDLVIIGVGVLPDTALAEAARLPCSDGVIVDEFARTAEGHIFAAGDCTNHPSVALGRRIRLQSVQNAAGQAKTAARNMLGHGEVYAELPWFWSEQYDLKLQIAGIGSAQDEQVLRGSPEQESFAVFYLHEGQVTSVEAVNRPRAFMAGKKLIAAQVAVSAAALADTDRSLTTIARATGAMVS